MSAEAKIRELVDEEDRVYVIGLPIDDLRDEEIASVSRALEESFDHAETFVLGLPLHEEAIISEFGESEIKEMRDYGDLLEAMDDG